MFELGVMDGEEWSVITSIFQGVDQTMWEGGRKGGREEGRKKREREERRGSKEGKEGGKKREEEQMNVVITNQDKG